MSVIGNYEYIYIICLVNQFLGIFMFWHVTGRAVNFSTRQHHGIHKNDKVRRVFCYPYQDWCQSQDQFSVAE